MSSSTIPLPFTKTSMIEISKILIQRLAKHYKFDEEEAYVVADMYIDFVRRQYMLPPSRGRLLGDLYFDVTASAVAQLSKNIAQINQSNWDYAVVIQN